MNKERYYVFFDIDGTLWDCVYRMYNKTELLKPESMKALNYLLDELDKKYDLQIIMTSRRRYLFKETCELLYNSGLDRKYNKIGKTPWVEGNRGKKILDFMKNDGYKVVYENNSIKNKLAKLFNVNIFKNYVVLDDDYEGVKDYIPDDRIISPNIATNALDFSMVKEFLSAEGIIDKVEKHER